MQENNNETVNTPVSSAPAQVSVQPRSTLVKDLMIPISIVVAGVFIGGGLYFGGSPAQQVGAAPAPSAPVAQADNTDKVNPVTADDHILGSLDAQVKVIEFSDFDCPFCSRFHDSMSTLVKNDPDVAWVYRHFPLEQLHPLASSVSMASECVAELAGNTAFWEFTDGYFAVRGAGNKIEHAALIDELAQATGVDMTSFTECFESGRHLDKIQADSDDAVETGGRGTPWSIIVGPTGKTYPINGALPESAIKQLIEVAKQEV